MDYVVGDEEERYSYAVRNLILLNYFREKFLLFDVYIELFILLILHSESANF